MNTRVFLLVSMGFFCSLYLFSSEEESHVSISIVSSNKKNAQMASEDVQHMNEPCLIKGRRKSLPTRMPESLQPVLINIRHLRRKSSIGVERRGSIAASLPGIREDESRPDVNRTITYICSNMKTSTRNSLGRAIAAGILDQFTRENDQKKYLYALEQMSQTESGQNMIMRQFLESYQCKYEKAVKKAELISKEEKLARDRAVQAIRIEGNKKLVVANNQRTRWKRIAVGATGASLAFATMAVLNRLI